MQIQLWPPAGYGSLYADDPKLDENASVMGTIRFTFKGALDAYHSDVLNVKTSTPTWL